MVLTYTHIHTTHNTHTTHTHNTYARAHTHTHTHTPEIQNTGLMYDKEYFVLEMKVRLAKGLEFRV